MRKGIRSPEFGDNGWYYLSTGDGGPLPGRPLHLVQYDDEGKIIREITAERESFQRPYHGTCRPEDGKAQEAAAQRIYLHDGDARILLGQNVWVRGVRVEGNLEESLEEYLRSTAGAGS